MLCTVVLGTQHARADALSPTLLAYKAPSDCPAVGDFQRSVQRRSTRIHFVDEGSHERELSIYLRKEGDYTIGELRLIEQNGTLRQRSVRFNTCAEAVEGLALIATVSLDPEALLAPPSPAPSTTTIPSAVRPPPNPPPPTHPETHPAAQPRPANPPRPAAPEPSGPETYVGAEPNVYLNALPTAVGGSVFVDVESASLHLFSPSIHAAISHVERLGYEPQVENAGEPDARANFALTLFTLAGCPLRLGRKVLVFRPCLEASGGSLRTWGTRTDTSSTDDNRYLSWGGSSRLTVRLGELAEIVGDASVGATIFRNKFAFDDPNNPFFTTRPLYISTGLGFRLRLP